MKCIIIFLMVCIGLQACDRAYNLNDEQEVIHTVNMFFKSLEDQDTSLYKEVVMMEGQIWRKDNIQNPSHFDMRMTSEDISSFDPQVSIREEAITFDIHLHEGLATAWVPYKLWINDEFVHCGVDVFTLMMTQKGWKIVSMAYTKDKKGCD